MFKDIVKQLKSISHSHWFWLMYIVGGIIMLAVALYHQYVLNEQPCVLCIQVRLWVSLFVIVSFIGLLFRNIRVVNSIAHLSVIVIAIGLMERSYQLLGTERGFILGACNFDLGLPAWFAVEEWLPWMFRVETTCGYSPVVAFGITMAEALIVLSAGMLLVSLSVALASFSRNHKQGAYKQ